MVKVKAYELRKKEKSELTEQLSALQKELAELRVAKMTNAQTGKVAGIKQVRKGIARVKTVINQQTKKALRKEFANKKFKPLDLRERKTRAMRRALTPKQKNLKTLRQQKKEAHFPQRTYALRA